MRPYFAIGTAVCMLLFCSSCGTSAPVPSSSPISSTVETEFPSITPSEESNLPTTNQTLAPTSTLDTTPPPEKINSSSTQPTPILDESIYVNDKLGFQMKIPESWNGLYEIIEGENSISFHNIKNYAAGYGGRLFTVFVTEEERNEIPHYKVLGYSEGRFLGISYPTDVQFSNDSSLQQEYQTMENDCQKIEESLILLPR